jgi:hypothetical protein
MARSLGEERFEAFWKSNASVPEAFHAAAGQDLDAWIREWGRRIYAPIPTGPGVPMAAVWSGVVALMLAVMLAIAIAQRRRVA